MMIAIRNLLRNPTRSFLTLLGISFGMAAYVALTSISDGLHRQVIGILDDYRIDLIVQARGVNSPRDSMIDLQDYERLSKLKGIADASAMVVGSSLIGSTEIPGLSRIIVIGTSSIEAIGSKLGLVEGRLLVPGRRELVLGDQAARKIECRSNDQVLVAEEKFTVSGVVTCGNAIFDGAALMGLDEANRLLKREGFVSNILIRLVNSNQGHPVIDAIEAQFPNLSAVRIGEYSGQNKLLNSVKHYARIITVMSLIICCIVVMNTLVLAVSERQKEIGILMAIGWSRAMVMKTIVSESMLICLLGGLLGNLIGMGLLWFFRYQNQAIGVLWLQVPVWLTGRMFFKALGFSIALGMVSSIYPALIASRRFPIQSLRSE